MKLSEAIRAGAKIRPQGRGRYFTFRRRWFGLRPPEKLSCALGAAMEAAAESLGSKTEVNERDFIGRDGTVHKVGDTQTWSVAPSEWYVALYSKVQCPQCERVDTGLAIIPHLNDDHKWAREEIALLVERLEAEAARNDAIAQAAEVEDVLDAEVIGLAD